MSRARRLLLIRGLGHSGTTILDLALGAHPDLIGLGEAVRVLRQPGPGEEARGPALLRGSLRHERLCTCGCTAATCPVWGPMLAWLADHDDRPLLEKVHQLLDGVAIQEPHRSWMVESYQDDMDLPLAADPELEIRILHLTRDLRSWVHSRAREGRRRGRWLPGLSPLLRWCRVNARQERLLRGCGRPVLHLGYEQLALQPEQSLRRVCDWLEIPFSERMLAPSRHSSSHILSGNRVRFDRGRGAMIRYDAAWLQAGTSLASLALLLPWVAALNRRLVYSEPAEGA